jgi:glutathione S-transferase
LEYKKLKYIKVNLLPGLHAKKAKKLSSASALPILVHDKKVIHESSEIINYLDQTFPDNSLTPNDPKLKQEAMQWERFADEEIGPDVRRVCYYTLLNHPEIITPYFTENGPWYGNLYMKATFPKLSSAMRKLMKLDDTNVPQIKQRLATAIAKTHIHIKDRDFFVGDTFSRADLAVASLLAPLCRAKKYGIEWPDQFPEPLHSTIGEFGDQLDWVKRIYSQYR